ncbi:MAG: transketolase [Syntrophomonadaceae bacterium]|nr:transketolase [Syntrophomonadaceae bacterium]
MRNAYIKAIYDLAKEDKNILALVADNGAIVFDQFRCDYPEQFINFGISEANMVSAAAGLANCGKIPFAYTIAGFITMRAFEQVRNDVCLQKQNVKLVGVGAGMRYSAQGPTHHATEDIAIMRVLPSMNIIVPASPREAYAATRWAAQINGPVYIRLEATNEPEIYEEDYEFQLGKGVILKDGGDITLVAAGSIIHDVLTAANKLMEKGIHARVINMPSIKPIDKDIIIEAAQETGKIITIEEHNVIGGLGSTVAEVLLENRCSVIAFKPMGLQDCFGKGYGSHAYIKTKNGLSPEQIIENCLKMIGTLY